MFSKAPSISYGKTDSVEIEQESKIRYVDFIRTADNTFALKLVELDENFESFGETSPKLFPYQLLVVKAMMDLEQRGRMQYLENNVVVTVDSCFGVLADKLGSGKTFSIMAVIKYAKPLPFKREFNSCFRDSMRRVIIRTVLKPTLFFVITAVFEERVKQLELFELKYRVIKSAADLNAFYKLVESGNKLEEYDVILFNTSKLTSKNIPEKFRSKIRETDTSINKFAIMFKGYAWNRIIIDDIDDFESRDLELARIIPAKFTWIISATVERFYQPRRDKNNKLYISLNFAAPVMRLFTIKCDDKFIEEQNDLPFIKAYVHFMNQAHMKHKTDIIKMLGIFHKAYRVCRCPNIPIEIIRNFNQGYYNTDCLPRTKNSDSILSVLSVLFYIYEATTQKVREILQIIENCKSKPMSKKEPSKFGLAEIMLHLYTLDADQFENTAYSADMKTAEEHFRRELLKLTTLMDNLKSSKLCITHCLDAINCNQDCDVIPFPEILAVENAPYKFLLNGQEITKLDNGATHTLQNILKRIIQDNHKGELMHLATNVSEKLFCGTRDCKYNANRSFLIYVEDSNLLSVVESIITDLGKTHVKNSAHRTKSKRIQSDFREGKLDVVFFHGTKSVSGMEFQTASDVIFIGAYRNVDFSAGKMAQMLGRCVRIGNEYNTQVHVIAKRNIHCGFL